MIIIIIVTYIYVYIYIYIHTYSDLVSMQQPLTLAQTKNVET